MKVAMLVDSHYPVKDGVVDAIDILRNELKERGHEVLLIAPDPGKGDRIDGVHYIPAKDLKGFTSGYYLPIFPSDAIFKLKEEKVDVINVHGFAFMAIRGVTFGKLLNIPVVLTFHTPVWDFIDSYSPFDTDLSLNLAWSYFRNLFKRASVTVAQTPSIAKELTANGVSADIRVIPTGIDTKKFIPGIDGSEVRERYGIKDKRVLIHVGRLSPEKRIEVMIKALAALDEDIVLMLVGRGELGPELKELALSLGVDKRIIFTGFVNDDELAPHYAAADMGISSSTYEAQCLAIMNAMACGLPVVCPHARAFVDYINDGENGYLYDGTPEGCAEAVKRCLSEGRSVSGNARTTAEGFSIPGSVDSYLSLYDEVIRTKRRG